MATDSPRALRAEAKAAVKLVARLHKAHRIRLSDEVNADLDSAVAETKAALSEGSESLGSKPRLSSSSTKRISLSIAGPRGSMYP